MPFLNEDRPDSYFDGAPTPRILDEDFGLVDAAAVVAGSVLLMAGVAAFEGARFVQKNAAPTMNRIREFGVGVLNIGSKS